MPRKTLVWILCMVMALFAIINTVKEESDKKEKERKTQQEVEDYIVQIIKENTKYETYTNDYLAYLKNNDSKGAYEVASKAFSEAKRLETFYASYNPPQGVPEHVLTLFEATGSHLSVAYAVRAEAYAHVMKFLDTRKQFDLDNANNKFAESEEYMLSATDTIKLIEKQMGIAEKKERH